MTNNLINETSPYLQEHAHQPVNWYPYSEEIFQKAEKENKPLIISIGYSTCHWCHVMADECFEDEQVAELMNNYFINVKVDREELPDVDKYYMNAIQVLTGRGGWPLNVFALSNKKPFYGVTYLPKKNWIDLLNKIHQLYIYEQDKLKEYAEDIHNNILHFELAAIHHNAINTPPTQDLQQVVNNWKNMLDEEWGGHSYVPKFVMPVNFKFFLNYLSFIKDKELEGYTHNSINKIILGGLFDHIEGGFYRYSTDRYWKIPHFEKMLYDNAQMIELLSLYYIKYPKQEVKWILEKNIQFLLHYFRSKESLFHSAWNADSEGEEGKFYIWTKDELKSILKNNYNEFAEMFNISNNFGYWEKNYYVLTINSQLFLRDIPNNMNKINLWAQLLYQYRNKRIRPSIDTKIITSWNSLSIKALTIASVALKNNSYLKIAEESLHALLSKVMVDEQLYRIYHHQQTKNPAYLDDYAFLIDALITFGKITAQPIYLNTAVFLTDQTIDNFYSQKQNIFYYTSSNHSIYESTNLYDDVIPSANAQMITNLLYLYHIDNHQRYKDIAQKSLEKAKHLFFNHPHHTASYGMLLLQNKFLDDLEITITGKDAQKYIFEMYQKTWNVSNIYSTIDKKDHAIFKNRFHPEKTFIYVCQHSNCYEPLESIHDFNISDFIL